MARVSDHILLHEYKIGFGSYLTEIFQNVNMLPLSFISSQTGVLRTSTQFFVDFCVQNGDGIPFYAMRLFVAAVM